MAIVSSAREQHVEKQQTDYNKIDRDEIAKLIPLNVNDYLSKQRTIKSEIDNLKTAAGVRVETRAPKNDFTESLRIAAGLK